MAVIKVPKSKKNAYKVLLKNKGQGKKVKIKQYNLENEEKLYGQIKSYTIKIHSNLCHGM